MYHEVSQNSLEGLETGQEAYTLLEEQKEEHGEPLAGIWGSAMKERGKFVHIL